MLMSVCTFHSHAVSAYAYMQAYAKRLICRSKGTKHHREILDGMECVAASVKEQCVSNPTGNSVLQPLLRLLLPVIAQLQN